MSTNQQDGSRPTVVLVHGAFADASGWNEVVERLQAEGVQVTASPNPLRGISVDSAYIASYLDQIPGPVLAVGHSYGGAVITNAATNANNVVGLVYVAAFAPDEGEIVYPGNRHDLRRDRSLSHRGVGVRGCLPWQRGAVVDLLRPQRGGGP